MAKQSKSEFVSVVAGFDYDLLEANVVEQVRSSAETIRQQVRNTLGSAIRRPVFGK
jgi:hypothetical protein